MFCWTKAEAEASRFFARDGRTLRQVTSLILDQKLNSNIHSRRRLIKMPKPNDSLESNKQDDYQIRYSLLLVARICSYFSNWGGGGCLQALRTTITFGSCLCPWVDNTQLGYSELRTWYLTLGI